MQPLEMHPQDIDPQLGKESEQEDTRPICDNCGCHADELKPFNWTSRITMNFCELCINAYENE